jgi:hypothetical protein
MLRLYFSCRLTEQHESLKKVADEQRATIERLGNNEA